MTNNTKIRRRPDPSLNPGALPCYAKPEQPDPRNPNNYRPAPQTQLLQWTPPPSSRPPPPQGPPSPTRRGQGPNQQYVATPGRSFNRQNSPERQQSSNQNIFPRGQGPQRDGRI